jgi:DNA-binding GntR family transcriptional regulator
MRVGLEEWPQCSLAFLYASASRSCVKKVNSDVAYHFIRERILSGEYPPGHPLATEILSARIGVSRTPVRDALQKLKADGLVSLVDRLGASVKKMDVKEFRELCELRLALESHAAGLAAINHSQADLGEIKYALESMRELTDRIIDSEGEAGLLEDLVREDVRYHIAIITAAKNDLMKDEILRLHLVNRVVVGPISSTGGKPTATRSKLDRDENRRRVLASHTEIFDAIAHGDAVESRRSMEQHIQDIIDKSLSVMARAGRGMSIRDLSDKELAYIG